MSNQSELISHMSSKDTKLSTHNKLRKSQQPRTCSVSLLLQPFKIKDHIICDHLKLGLFKFDSELANFLFNLYLLQWDVHRQELVVWRLCKPSRRAVELEEPRYKLWSTVRHNNYVTVISLTESQRKLGEPVLSACGCEALILTWIYCFAISKEKCLGRCDKCKVAKC